MSFFTNMCCDHVSRLVQLRSNFSKPKLNRIVSPYYHIGSDAMAMNKSA